jgi:hypothetical protein
MAHCRREQSDACDELQVREKRPPVLYERPRTGSLNGFTRFDSEQRTLILTGDDIQQPVRALTNIANSLM